MIKENLYALQEDLLRAYIVFNPKKKLHVPHLKCVKNKFHNKRNDTEPRYKSKRHAIYVFVDLHLADDRRIYIKHKDISSSLRLYTHICI